jgi:hypothetical protein
MHHEGDEILAHALLVWMDHTLRENLLFRSRCRHATIIIVDIFSFGAFSRPRDRRVTKAEL